MIIQSLFDLFIGLFTGLLGFINIPQIPIDVQDSVNSTIDTIIERGSELVDLFLPYNVAKTLLLIVIGIEAAVHIYQFVMWVVKKIPMAGIR